MADLLLGQVLSYAADPFAEGIGAARHESAGAVLVEDGRIVAVGAADRLRAAHPQVEFVGPCNMCPYMKMITLEKVLWSLHTMTTPVEVDPELIAPARAAVERMIEISRRPRAAA